MQRIKITHLFLASLTALSLLASAACQCDESKLFNKTWLLEKYGPESALQAVIPGTPPAKPEITLQQDGNGHFSGNDGCNLIGGVYKFGANCQIRFDSIRHTLMYCGDSLIIVQAGAINDLIWDVATYEVTDSELKLRTPAKGVLQYQKN